jgi:hypothetical protein
MGSPKEKLSFFKTKKNRTLYSPKLNDVWYKNYTGPFYPSDWFNGQRIFSQIILVSDSSPKIWRAYWAALHQIESAFLLKHFYLLIKKNRSLKKGVYLNKEKMFPICWARPINWFAPPITLLKFSPEPCVLGNIAEF